MVLFKDKHFKISILGKSKKVIWPYEWSRCCSNFISDLSLWIATFHHEKMKNKNVKVFFLTDLPKNANLLKEALTGFSCWPGSSGNWSIWMARRNPRFRRSRRGRGRPERTRRSRWTPSTAGLPTVRTCGPWQCRMSAGWCCRERPCKDIKVWSMTPSFPHTNKYENP